VLRFRSSKDCIPPQSSSNIRFPFSISLLENTMVGVPNGLSEATIQVLTQQPGRFHTDAKQHKVVRQQGHECQNDEYATHFASPAEDDGEPTFHLGLDPTEGTLRVAIPLRRSEAGTAGAPCFTPSPCRVHLPQTPRYLRGGGRSWSNNSRCGAGNGASFHHVRHETEERVSQTRCVGERATALGFIFYYYALISPSPRVNNTCYSHRTLDTRESFARKSMSIHQWKPSRAPFTHCKKYQ